MSVNPDGVRPDPHPEPVEPSAKPGAASNEAQDSAAPPKIAAGDVYRRVHPTDPDLTFDLTVIRRVETWGGWRLGSQPIPSPVIGSVWVGELCDDNLGTAQVLCTPEGLAKRGFQRIDPNITERPTDA